MPENDLPAKNPWTPAFAGMTEIKPSHVREFNLTTRPRSYAVKTYSLSLRERVRVRAFPWLLRNDGYS